MREIETGDEATFETEDMEEEIYVDPIMDRDGNVIKEAKYAMAPKPKYAGPTGLAKWTSLYRRNEDRRTRHVMNKQKVMKLMFKSIDDDIYCAIEIMEGLEDHKRFLNVKAIYEAIKFASTGQGGHKIFSGCFQAHKSPNREQQMADIF